VAGEILQVDDVASLFAGGRECRNSEAVNGDIRIKTKPSHVASDELLYGAAGEKKSEKKSEETF